MTTARRMSLIFGLGALSCLMLAAAVAPSFAAESPRQTIDVPFAFLAGDAQLASGTYRVYAWSADGSVVIRLEGPAGKAEVPVVTRLARKTAAEKSSNLVFDTTEGKKKLSEVWLPGVDGYLVGGNLADKQHDHTIVAGKESK